MHACTVKRKYHNMIFIHSYKQNRICAMTDQNYSKAINVICSFKIHAHFTWPELHVADNPSKPRHFPLLNYNANINII